MGDTRIRFQLGRPVSTPGALESLLDSGESPLIFLARHARGDWGDLDPENHRANEDALRHGSRLLSAYRTDRGGKLWIITEADRSVTTLLLPEEY